MFYFVFVLWLLLCVKQKGSLFFNLSASSIKKYIDCIVDCFFFLTFARNNRTQVRRWLIADKRTIITVVMMLVLGGLLYLLFRPRTLLLFHVADAMGLSSVITRCRSAVEGITLPDWMIYCLPNALWAGAYVLLADSVLKGRSLRLRLLVTAVIPGLGILSEVMQAFRLLPGTFDGWDLVAYALPYMLYLIISPWKL